MPKARVRFVFDTGGQLSELFSVIEKADGTLNVIYSRSAEYEDRYGKSSVEIDKTTVHTSARSKDGGKTFMSTLKLGDGRVYRSSAYILPNNYGLSWIIRSGLSQDRSLNIYDCKPSKSDQIIVLDRMNPKRMALVYHVVVSDNIYFDSIFNINSFHKIFKRFNISVYWIYLAAPSCPYGRDISLGTSLMTINGLYTQLDPPFPLSGAISPTTIEISNAFDRNLALFQATHLQYLQQWYIAMGLELTEELREKIRYLVNVLFIRPPLEFSSADRLGTAGVVVRPPNGV